MILEDSRQSPSISNISLLQPSKRSMTGLQYFGFILTAFLASHLKIHVLAEVPCIKKTFLKPVPNKALVNHVISNSTVTSEEGCKIQCFIEATCESYNFGLKEDVGYVCELSNSDAIRDPQDWVAKQRHLYVGTLNPCETAQCPVNARCFSDFEHEIYQCVCMPGFTDSNCKSHVEESREGFHGCDSNGTCNDTKRSHICSNKLGYNGDGNNSCKDIDECRSGLHGCHSDALCNNTQGSYSCNCKPGFFGDGTNSCIDIDECRRGLHGCHSDAVCNNTQGSYSCICKPGFFGDGKNSCFASTLNIYIRSEGFHDPPKTSGAGSRAYVVVNGKDHSSNFYRGHNVVIVDAKTGAVLESNNFDTYGDSSAGARLRDYLNDINGSKIVLVAIQDSGSKHVSAALNAIERLGATAPILVAWRASFAFAGYAEPNKPSWVTQGQHRSYRGPSVMSLVIPLQSHQSASFLKIFIRSEGFHDPRMISGRRAAYVFVNGIDYSPYTRGHNVVIVDAETGAVLESSNFDTFGDSSAGVKLRDYLNSIKGNKIVLVAIEDDGSKFLSPALDALKRLGATDPISVAFRGSFAFAGYAETNKPSWVTQEQHERYKGPSIISLIIPLQSRQTNIDECATGHHGCHSYASCNNTEGSYICICKPGFHGDGRNSCVDIDECTKGLHRCHRNASCQNTEGSHNCSCKPGFSGDGASCELLGSTQELAVPSCHTLSSVTHPSGIYWVDPDGGPHANAFKAYCEMETDGGGWTLVWSYTFTDYDNFWTWLNAVTPRPAWPNTTSDSNVPVSTTPPLNETDYNAMEFSLWKQFGRQILIKNNINNWIVCLPNTGSLVEWQSGSVVCNIVMRVNNICPDGPPPSVFIPENWCGPSFNGGHGDFVYYYFDACTGRDYPTHDPCGEHEDNALKNVEKPHGNIYVR